MEIPRAAWVGLIISSVGAVLVGSLIIGSVVSERNREKALIRVIEQTTANKREYLQQLEADAAAFDAREQELRERQRDLRRLENKLELKRSRVLVYSNSVRTKARGGGAKYRLYEMTPAGVEPAAPYHHIKYNLELHGDVRRLTSLVNQLYSTGKAMFVHKMDVSLTEFGSTFCVVKISATLYDYDRPQIPKGTEPIDIKQVSAFTEHTAPFIVEEKWKKLDGPKVVAARGALDEVRKRVGELGAAASRREALDRRAAALDQWAAELQTLEDRRASERQGLLEAAPRVSTRALESETGTAVAKRDKDGKLEIR